MSRKPRKGYFVRGQFVAAGSELDEQITLEQRGDGPSKTELKSRSAELQALGEQLLGLRADLFDSLALPAVLTDALHELKRITSFEGRRRQSQYVGKLMRQLDGARIDAVRAALTAQRQGAAQDALLLHAAEQWRERLLAEDDALTDWAARFPRADMQPLRALVRQARKDTHAPIRPGQAPRQGRAYRELFQLLRGALEQASITTPENP
jgi:ribosome-associated protein